MIEDNFFKGVDLIIDEYKLNSCEKMIRIVLASHNYKKQSEIVFIIEGDYKMYFEPKENYILNKVE